MRCRNPSTYPDGNRAPARGRRRGRGRRDRAGHPHKCAAKTLAHTLTATGRLLGAAGAVEAVATVQAIRTGALVETLAHTLTLIGRLLGAAGAVEAVATVQAIRRGCPVTTLSDALRETPPIIPLQTP